jgi:hypothetical protein
MPDVAKRGARALGLFLGSARWITTPHTNAARIEKSGRTQTHDTAHEVFARITEEQAQGPDTELSALLDAITDEVQRIAAAACEGITRDFAARMAYARRYLPRHALAAALSALSQERKAALAIVKRYAAQELAGRKKIAIEARRRPAEPKPFGPKR